MTYANARPPKGENHGAATRRFGQYRAVRDTEMPATAKLVLFVLMTYANGTTDLARPSVGTIARGAGLGTTATREALAWLVRAGFLVVEGEPSLGRRANSYRLTLPNPSPGVGFNPTAGDANATPGGDNPTPRGGNATPGGAHQCLNSEENRGRGTGGPPTHARGDRDEAEDPWGLDRAFAVEGGQ